MPSFRTEKDALGTKKLPPDAPWGIFTQRALENFPISGHAAHPALLHALALVKRAAAETNARLKVLPQKIARAIIRAADDVVAGKVKNAFPLDPFQAGAGTPWNMNMNEVLARRAARFAKKNVHPNDHVNKSQSTNDVIPTALRIAVLWRFAAYAAALKKLRRTFQTKARTFKTVLKSGRTHLSDAVPVSLGQEFAAYAANLEEHEQRIREITKKLVQLNIGGTATGTGLNTHPRYRLMMVKTLSRLTSFRLTSKKNLMAAMQSSADFADAANVLKLLALDLNRIANDLRLLASGPATGFNEIRLPEVEPGSSIMPGKMNPSMLEMVNMVCYHIMGRSYGIDQAAGAGQLELNVMNPMIAHDLLESIDLLTNAMHMMEEKCISGITANKEVCRAYLEKSPATATALTPIIGYARAAELVKESMRTGKTIRELARTHKLLPKKELDRLLDFRKMLKPNLL